MNDALKRVTLSVIVPIYNKASMLRRSLERLYVLRENPVLGWVQIIVVDDGSSDRTPKELQIFGQDCD